MRPYLRANGDDRNPALFLQTDHRFIGEAVSVNLCRINWLFEYRHIRASAENGGKNPAVADPERGGEFKIGNAEPDYESSAPTVYARP